MQDGIVETAGKVGVVGAGVAAVGALALVGLKVGGWVDGKVERRLVPVEARVMVLEQGANHAARESMRIADAVTHMGEAVTRMTLAIEAITSTHHESMKVQHETAVTLARVDERVKAMQRDDDRDRSDDRRRDPQ